MSGERETSGQCGPRSNARHVWWAGPLLAVPPRIFSFCFPHGVSRWTAFFRGLFQPFHPGEGLLHAVLHGELAGAFSLIGAATGFCQLSHGLCLLIRLLSPSASGPHFSGACPPRGIRLTRFQSFCIGPFGCQAGWRFPWPSAWTKGPVQMEETGHAVKGRRPALLEVRKSLFAAAYDVFF